MKVNSRPEKPELTPTGTLLNNLKKLIPYTKKIANENLSNMLKQEISTIA